MDDQDVAVVAEHPIVAFVTEEFTVNPINEPMEVFCGELFRKFEEFCQRNNVTDKWSAERFGLKLTRLKIPGVSDAKTVKRKGDVIRARVFHPEVCEWAQTSAKWGKTRRKTKRKRPRAESEHMRKAVSGPDNLYCVQWVNIMDGKAVPAPYYKIGRGHDGREAQVHGQNPVKFPIVNVWTRLGVIETLIHHELHDYRINMGGGVEWFDLSHVDDDVSSFIEKMFSTLTRRTWSLDTFLG